MHLKTRQSLFCDAGLESDSDFAENPGIYSSRIWQNIRTAVTVFWRVNCKMNFKMLNPC